MPRELQAREPSLPVVHLTLPRPDETNRPHQVQDEDYVSSDACKSCHPDQYASWHASYHRTMTQLPSAETVLGDFDNAITRFYASKQRFFREGNGFLAEIEIAVGGGESPEADPPRIARLQMPVALVTGSHHAQVYWFSVGRGRQLEMMPFFYLLEEQRWIPRNAAFLRPGGPDRADEWQSWNENCLRCHSTHPRPRQRETVDTKVAEFGISCEACHGPARRHVAMHEQIGTQGDADDAALVDPRQLDSRASSQVCGQCHSVWDFGSDKDRDHWNAHGLVYRPGDELEKTRLLEVPSRVPADQRVPSDARERLVFDGTFWPDGMVRVSGREYNGLIDSPCFQRGELTCLSCHTMHPAADDAASLSAWADDQLAPGMQGNLACTQCHQEFEESAALLAHTHHPAGSAGSQCYNCHMPHTTYGILKAMRSHQIDSPDLANSLAAGRPNACNLCHLDQTLEWTATHLQDWYGKPPPSLSEDQREVAAGPLWLLSGDAAQRALVAWSMKWPAAREASGTNWLPPFLAQLLIDPYPAVRLLAHRALRNLPGYETTEYDFVGTLDSQHAANDAVREVWERRTAEQRAAWPAGVRRALSDFARLLGMRDDRPMFLLE